MDSPVISILYLQPDSALGALVVGLRSLEMVILDLRTIEEAEVMQVAPLSGGILVLDTIREFAH